MAAIACTHAPAWLARHNGGLVALGEPGEMTMNKNLVVLAVLFSLGGVAQAGDVFGGVGAPGLYSIGYAQPMGSNWGLRGEYAAGLSMSKDGVQSGISATGSLKASQAGVFADWFPFDGGFRLVGGLTMNDIKAEFKSVGGSATINGKPVNLTGETFNVNLTYPNSTAYLGLGFGHQSGQQSGLGFYADLGVTIGSFNSDVSTSVLNKTYSGYTITQTDIDAQTKTMRDSISSLTVLPRAAIGLTYRY